MTIKLTTEEEMAFLSLWQVEGLMTINSLEKEMGDSRVEMSGEALHNKSINLIRLGFKEGIKFAKRGKSE